MATQAYWDWVARGRGYRLARPISELKMLAKTNRVGFLGDLGSDDKSHLQAARPLDHCPFSFDAWPVPLPGYVVCALDLKDGPHSDRMLDDARAGRAPWVKYLIFRGRSYSIRSGWVAKSATDQHLHISVRSDWVDRSIGTYSPWIVPILDDGDDMKYLAQLNGDTTVYFGNGISCRAIGREQTVREMLAEGARGDWLSSYYVPNGRPFKTMEEMQDRIGTLV